MSYGTVEHPRFDVDGFMVDAGEWTEELAIELAASSGIEELTRDHWRLIRALRSHHGNGKPDLFPQVRHVCQELNLQESCVAQMFGDPLIAWKVAGLPRMAQEMSAYMPGSELA